MIDAYTIDLHEGSELHGYKVLQKSYLSKLNIFYYELEHIKSGAKHIHISTDDKDNGFAVTFKTTPQDSTGVAHILEHTVLCGSKKYPVRDPFFSMIKRSLNTFMNAMTSSDWTSYPFSTKNKTDYYNLLDIYLDAAFNPLLNKLDFMQEGHRLEFTQPDSTDSDLTISGVVYNEMKGAMSDSRSLLWDKLGQSLFSTTTYHYNSGGDPAIIPDLTYEQFVEFHKRYYHPSNSYFYTYGNLPLNDHLKFINDRILSNYSKIDPKTEVNDEVRYTKPQNLHYSYPLNENDNDGKRNFYALSWLLCTITETEELLSLKLLDQILLGHSGAILNKNLMESKLGKSLISASGLADQSREVFFTAGLEGVSETDYKAIEKIILDTLQKVAENGIPQNEIDTALHQFEYHTRDINGGHYAYFLSLLFRMMGSMIHGGKSIDELDLDKTIENIKEKIKKGGFFEALIKKHFLNNQHRVEVVLSPDSTLEAREEALVQKHLKERKDAMTDDEKIAIKEQSSLLKERQDSEDDPSVLPKINISDIDRKITILQPRPVKKHINSVPVSLYEQTTNGIVKAGLLFDVNHLSDDELSLLPVFTLLLTQSGAGGKTYDTVAEDVSRYTGGISSSVRLVTIPGNASVCNKYVKIKSGALAHNTEKMFQLITNFITEWDFSDINRTSTLIKKKLNNLESDIVSSGHRYAMGLSGRFLTESSYYSEMFSGITHLRKLQSLAQSDENGIKIIIEKLNSIGKKVFGKNNLIAYCVAQKADLEIDGVFEKFTGELHDIELHKQKSEGVTPKNLNEAWTTTTPVSYVAKSFKVPDITGLDSAALRLLSNLIGLTYLHPEVREKGGAYGGFCSYNNLNGIISFGSYRDPHFMRTVNTYNGVIDFLKSGTIPESDVSDLKIKILGELDGSGTPSELAVNDFFSELSGVTDDVKQKFKDAVFKLELQDVINAGLKYLQTEGSVSAITSDEILEKEKITGITIEKI
ncbi:MAG: hypothetical protein A2015_17570 [Spirochaetes bacterium GWF1_31_7]|nr:MAG: hypothetical protein A2Y30_05560 [Spirochaetes bacterium GWE1_32_154]OHD47279.1 MAG: hypothetical protein A2015_17570 [Spirochaetes bacterium GWF1_31_7]OHD49457.1 MAG: hypothetical protein A2Y29_01620 [Spirochaetes bacterium GWE2_31_10]